MFALNLASVHFLLIVEEIIHKVLLGLHAPLAQTLLIRPLRQEREVCISYKK